MRDHTDLVAQSGARDEQGMERMWVVLGGGGALGKSGKSLLNWDV